MHVDTLIELIDKQIFYTVKQGEYIKIRSFVFARY